MLLVSPGYAVYLGDAGKTLSNGSVTLIKLNTDVDNKYTDTTEVNSLIGTAIGAAKLEDLDSVEITAPGENEVLKWNNTTHVWENGTVTGVGDMLKSTYDTEDDGTVNSARKLDADYVGDGLEYDGDSLSVKLNGTTLSVDGNGLAVGTIDTANIAADAVGHIEIDWNTPGSAPFENLVDATRIPLYDVGTYYTTDNVEAALQAVGSALSTLSSKLAVDDVSHTVEIFTTDSADYVCNLTYEPVWTPDVFYGRSVIQQPDVDFTYNLSGQTVTLDGGESGVAIAVSYYYVTP